MVHITIKKKDKILILIKRNGNKSGKKLFKEFINTLNLLFNSKE